jgi:hypothetical protein
LGHDEVIVHIYRYERVRHFREKELQQLEQLETKRQLMGGKQFILDLKKRREEWMWTEGQLLAARLYHCGIWLQSVDRDACSRQHPNVFLAQSLCP